MGKQSHRLANATTSGNTLCPPQNTSHTSCRLLKQTSHLEAQGVPFLGTQVQGGPAPQVPRLQPGPVPQQVPDYQVLIHGGRDLKRRLWGKNKKNSSARAPEASSRTGEAVPQAYLPVALLQLQGPASRHFPSQHVRCSPFAFGHRDVKDSGNIQTTVRPPSGPRTALVSVRTYVSPSSSWLFSTSSQTPPNLPSSCHICHSNRVGGASAATRTRWPSSGNRMLAG